MNCSGRCGGCSEAIPNIWYGRLQQTKDPSLGGRPSGRRDLELRLGTFLDTKQVCQHYEISFPDKCMKKSYSTSECVYFRHVSAVLHASLLAFMFVYDSKANRAADITLQAGRHTTHGLLPLTSLRSRLQRAVFGLHCARNVHTAYGIYDRRTRVHSLAGTSYRFFLHSFRTHPTSCPGRREVLCLGHTVYLCVSYRS
jgi:hypothetical protein